LAETRIYKSNSAMSEEQEPQPLPSHVAEEPPHKPELQQLWHFGDPATRTTSWLTLQQRNSCLFPPAEATGSKFQVKAQSIPSQTAWPMPFLPIQLNAQDQAAEVDHHAQIKS